MSEEHLSLLRYFPSNEKNNAVIFQTYKEAQFPYTEELWDGNTLLRRAVIDMRLELVRRLLDDGAPIDEIDKKNQSLLQAALNNLYKKDAIQMIRLLITRGVNINHRDNDGRTALHSVTDRSYYNENEIPLYKEALQLLLSAGATIQKDKKNTPPLTIHTPKELRKLLVPYVFHPSESSSPFAPASEFPTARSETGCEDEIETLHQVSGQCWNDAIFIFLWFSAGIGRKIQDKLQDLTLLKKLEAWLWYQKSKHQSLFPQLQDKDAYREFETNLLEYVRCMQLRYENWKGVIHPKKKKEHLFQRQDSCIYSLCSAESGIRIQRLLEKKMDHQKKLPETSGLPSLQERIEQIQKGKLYKEENFGPFVKRETKETFEKLFPIASSFGGKDTYAYLVEILLDFFLGGIQSRRYTTLLNVTPERLVLPPYTPLFYPLQENAFEQIQLLLQRERRLFLSLEATVKVIYSENYHAITLLTCDTGGHYLYDDNNGSLVEVDWTAIFTESPSPVENLFYNSDYQGLRPFPILGVQLPPNVVLFKFVFDSASPYIFYITTGGKLIKSPIPEQALRKNVIYRSRTLPNAPYPRETGINVYLRERERRNELEYQIRKTVYDGVALSNEQKLAVDELGLRIMPLQNVPEWDVLGGFSQILYELQYISFYEFIRIPYFLIAPSPPRGGRRSCRTYRDLRQTKQKTRRRR